MFDPTDLAHAQRLVDQLTALGLTMATAESCTGGLIAGLVTEIPGASVVLDRGFVTYSNAAKCDLLGVPATLIGRYGAVSAEVGVAMVSGALRASCADVAVAVTGVAGPGGGTSAKPVGLVHVAGQMRGGHPRAIVLQLGDIGRSAIRLETVRQALWLVASLLDQPTAAVPTGAP
jgi:nicotinamide-nucleotide amidase